jgi:transposase
MARAQPNRGEWHAFYARMIQLFSRNGDRPDEAGTFARRLHREMDSLWLFLIREGVAHTNNHAEWMLRFAVPWRERSQGSASDKGNRWVERILSLRQTCRPQPRNLFAIMVDALQAHFNGQVPSPQWIASSRKCDLCDQLQ